VTSEPQTGETGGAERRREENRRSVPRRAEDRQRESRERLRAVTAALTAVCGGLAAIFLFFAVLGAVDLADAAGATAIALVLALVWVGGFWYRVRSGAGSMHTPDRERRGF